MAAHPHFPWLSAEDAPGLQRFLIERRWIGENERVIALAPAGAGNMNLTLRATTTCGSLVVKQARPWVEKYDHLAAPWDRGRSEAEFYRCVAAWPEVAGRMPRLLAADLEAGVLLLEDLPEARDLTSLYRGDVLTEAELAALADFAARLHVRSRREAGAGLPNRQMRALNHQHIFVIPLAADNGLPLDDYEAGLKAQALRLAEDHRFCEAVAATGRRYLADGQTLVHGDYFPGSWLRTRDGLRVIDPEFCFSGDGEFDLACAIAHLALAGQPRLAAERLTNAYLAAMRQAAGDTAAGRRDDPDEELLSGYAACEVMRRLIGVAQLPLDSSRIQRGRLLARAREALLERRWERLWEATG